MIIVIARKIVFFFHHRAVMCERVFQPLFRALLALYLSM